MKPEQLPGACLASACYDPVAGLTFLATEEPAGQGRAELGAVAKCTLHVQRGLHPPKHHFNSTERGQRAYWWLKAPGAEKQGL